MNRRAVLLAAAVVTVAIALGMFSANWVLSHRKSSADLQRIDEYLGLGERTGLTGDLALQVDPLDLAVKPGEPAVVKLALKNTSRSTIYLNGWLQPTPSNLGDNQFPLKVSITQDDHPVRYEGNFTLPPPHGNRDFFALAPGAIRKIPVDISKSPGNGRWGMARPGSYNAEIWYETYLTGKYVGVRAWTGMTNHVIVHVKVSEDKRN